MCIKLYNLIISLDIIIILNINTIVALRICMHHRVIHAYNSLNYTTHALNKNIPLNLKPLYEYYYIYIKSI